MFSWGRCDSGQLGLGGIQDEEISVPRNVTELPLDDLNFKDVQAGDSHAVMLSNDGKVFTCGSNDQGQLGHECLTQRRFGQVSSLAPYTVKSISCGSNHTLAVDEWGKVFSWGSDSTGQLGHNQGQEYLKVPKLIKCLGPVNVIQVASGDNHCLALAKGGQLYAWGDNEFGQLGLGPCVGQKVNVPTPVECLTSLPIRSISAGSHHSFLVSVSGAVYAWGKNNKGQLGLGDNQDRIFPTQVRSLRNQKICHVTCGAEHTLCLTEEGGVFSFGSGQFGQLGHGSKSDEQLPRKIIELMGTEVSQIACGKKHSLAFVPTRGRLYAFGLGGSGQLGNNVYTCATTPQIVHGPWVGPTGEPSAPKRIIDEMDVDGVVPVVVTKVGAGGDQSFALVKPMSQENPKPYDFRTENDPELSLSKLTPEIVQSMKSVRADETLEQDFIEKLETIFQSPACLNASFLLPTHKPCTSKNPGVDIQSWTNTTQALCEVKNETIKELITAGLTKHILPKLENNPPDVETLRQFLFLTLFDEFANEELFNEIHCQYARSWISLPKAAWNVVEKWFAQQDSKDYFLIVVQMFKEVAIHILNLKTEANIESAHEKELGLVLVFLRILNRINMNHNLISFEEFYISEVKDLVNLQDSYIKWMMAKSRGIAANEFHICNFPFIFDASAKTTLLQTDQAFQMHNAANSAINEAAMMMLFRAQEFSPENIANLVCHVRRDHLVEDTLTFIRCVPDIRDFKKPLKVKFDGEEADDAGGVRKEFFLLLLKEILDPKYGMFKEYEETYNIWFHPNCFEDVEYFFMIGVLCGLAIYNFTIINLPFPLVLYKKLLSEDPNSVGSIEDVEDLSPALAKGLRDLLAYEGDDVEDVFCLNFAVVEDVFGENVTKELKPGGENVAVTKENKEEYVKLYCDYLLNKSVERLYQAFHAGFHKVCGGRVMDLFQPRELMVLVVGSTNYDWEEFEKHTDYKNGYDKDHQTVRYFWEVFHELSEEDKRKFLLFLTGTDRIPILGMISKKLTIQKTGDPNYLPVAHTCFNLLDLPEYATKEKLKFKLLQAIHGTQGFGLV